MSSAISGYISQIQNAVYGEQVRSAIVNALEACYSDVNNPSLMSEGFENAIEEAYAGGILDIQTVTQISAMTNDKIIYRYNGTETGKNKGLYYYSPITSAWVLVGSEIQEVSLANQMTDTKAIYKYSGTETGYVSNSLYCYNGTAWVPIGSGVLTASTAALMTNTGAIYKYTGSETGYTANALYYHNGTSWVMLPSAETLASSITEAKADIMDDITEYSAVGNGNLLMATPPERLGYYYSSTDQSIVQGDTVGSLFRYTSDHLVSLPEDVPCYINIYASDISSGATLYAQCWGEENYISATSAIAITANTNTGFVTPAGTRQIRFLFTAAADYDFSKIYVSIDSVSSIEESTPTLQIKSDLLTVQSETMKNEILDEFTEGIASGDNLIDPENVKPWGFTYQTYDGAKVNNRAGNDRVTKEPILVDNVTTLYLRRNAAPTSQISSMTVFGYDNTMAFVGYTVIDIGGTWTEKTITLPTGSYYIHLKLNMFEYQFKAENLCLSFNQLEAFEPYTTQERFIKQDLIPNRAAYSNKKFVFLGDSIFAADDSPTSVPFYFGKYTGIDAINCCIGGTSAEIRNEQGSVYSKWCTLVELSKAINTGEWTTILEKANEQLTGQPLQRVIALSEMDWTKVDTIVIAHGYNDDYGGEEPADPMDTSTYPGAMRYSINAIQTAYPNIRMFACTMIPFGNFYSQTEEQQEKILYGNTRLKSICDEFGIGYIYNWNIFGKNTYQVYLYNPYVHPTEEGKKQIARHVAHEIW